MIWNFVVDVGVNIVQGKSYVIIDGGALRALPRPADAKFLAGWPLDFSVHRLIDKKDPCQNFRLGQKKV